ncbi:MAG: AAA family ATPase, partial [Jatrophihabitans sp.]
MSDSTGLGARPQDFFGRRAELRRLDELAAAGATPVIGVSGPDGVGKSALVAHWARRAARLFPDGQVWLNCSGPVPQSPGRAADLLTELLAAVGSATGDLPARADARAELWQAALQGKRMLIVLDGATGTDQVRPLLARTPGCVTVVISIGKLPALVDDDDAGWVPVPRMSTADAVLALATPAAAAGVPESEVAVLAEHSAGLPLTVRIVGALLATASRSAVTSLASELEAGAGSEHRVDAVLRAAHAALPPAANRMLPLLALCPGTDIEFDATCAATGLAE